MRPVADTQKLSNVAASSDAFELVGGYYMLSGVATWGGGSLKLQQLGPDGSTYLDTAASLTANGIAYAYCAPGQYKLTVATATALYTTLVRVPLD